MKKETIVDAKNLAIDTHEVASKVIDGINEFVQEHYTESGQQGMLLVSLGALFMGLGDDCMQDSEYDTMERNRVCAAAAQIVRDTAYGEEASEVV